MSETLVTVQVDDDGVAEVTMNRAEALNALSPALIDALSDAFRALDRTDGARVILLSGAGRHFCAGADIGAMSALPVAELVRTAFTGCCHALAAVGKPVVAAVQGYALGGGCELVEMCDIVVAARDAVFGHPEVTVGTMPGAGGSQRLPRVLGKHKAMDLLLTGRRMDAVEAERLGLVSRVVEPDRLMPEARAVAGTVAAHPPAVLRMIKESVAAAFETNLRDGLVLERGLFHRSLTLEDAREGMMAFREKRKPVFAGR